MIVEKIELEEKYEVVDYKKKLEERIDFIEFMIGETEIQLKKGVDDKELEKMCKNNIKRSSALVEKYKQIMENDEKEELDYEQIYKEFLEDEDKVDKEREKERLNK